MLNNILTKLGLRKPASQPAEVRPMNRHERRARAAIARKAPKRRRFHLEGQS